jgi:hypothetical protein
MSMNNVTKETEQMHCLVDIGAGLLHQLYFTKAQILATDGRYSLANDAVLSKVRAKLEKKFPALPDFSKGIAGSDQFMQKTDDILRDFEPFHKVLEDVADFCVAAKELLTDYLVKIIDFRLRKNKPLMLVYFNLLTTYMRVLYLVESIEPRVGISAFYTAAAAIKNVGAGAIASAAQRIKELFSECADLQRHFIDTFAASQIFIFPMLQQLRDSLMLVGNADELRKSCVLNPINLGDNMGVYAKKNLSLNHGSVSAYTEIGHAVEQYVDYVVFALLACPGLFFAEPASLELLSIVTKHRMFVGIFRDVVSK